VHVDHARRLVDGDLRLVEPRVRKVLASEPVEGTGGELKPAPESFAIVLASPE